MTDGTLLRPVNITNLFLQNSYIIIMALGMLIVIVGGHIDLSVGLGHGVHRRAGGGDGRGDGPSPVVTVTIPACLLAGIGS
jgi:putative multiple sugar transport system permease protein